MRNWCLTLCCAVLGLVLFSLGFAYAGGGHGWGTQLLWYAFRPAIWAANWIDPIYDDGFDVPSLEQEIGLIKLTGALAIVQLALVGLGIDVLRHYRKSTA